MRTLAKNTGFAALLVAGITALGAAHAGAGGDEGDRLERLAQMAELEQQIHATFHSAVSVHDPVNGDTQEVITQRIRRYSRFGRKTAKSPSSTLVPRQEITSAMVILMIPQLALHPRAIRLPTVNKARCAHCTSMSPVVCRKLISGSRLPRRTKPSMFL
jgi:hypothetical protein